MSGEGDEKTNGGILGAISLQNISSLHNTVIGATVGAVGSLGQAVGVTSAASDTSAAADDLNTEKADGSPASSEPVYVAIPVDDEQYKPVVDDPSVPIIAWKNLSVTSTPITVKVTDTLKRIFKLEQKGDVSGYQLLKNVSGQINGGFWAVMGASGCGKTTLMNALARRLDLLRAVCHGEQRVNGKEYTKKDLKRYAGYVMQDDLLNARFTVEETLYYNAEFRISGSVPSYADRRARVDYILDLLDIRHCKDVLVGDSRVKGISGGERKRLAVGIELLSSPKLLFLDEPTTGLDSTNALKLITALHKLTDDKQCTLITTIHQPGSQLFDLLDNVILMRGGEIIFQGRNKAAVQHFEQLGYPFPADTNPADYLVDLLSANTGDFQAVQAADAAAKAAKIEPVVDLFYGQERDCIAGRTQTSYPVELYKLFERSFIEYSRKRWDYFIKFWCVLIVSLFISATVWHQIGHDQASIALRRTVLYFCVVHQGVVSSFLGICSYPLDRVLMLRERHAGTYRVSSYFLAKSTVEVIFNVPFLIMFSLITYYRIGFREGASHVMIYTVILILADTAALSLTNAMSVLFVSIEVGTVANAFAFELVRYFGGWYVSPIVQRQYPLWKFFNFCDYLHYAFMASTINEFKHLPLHCKKEQYNAKGVCPITDGSVVLAQYGYDQITLEEAIGYLILIIVIWRFISYLALRFIKF